MFQAKQEGKPISENFGYEYSLDSKIMSENRKYLLHLPESYQESEQSYPVIYTLMDLHISVILFLQ